MDAKTKFDTLKPFHVKSVDGYAMLLNIKKIQETLNFNHKNFFDENFFMYLENDDLCKRIIDGKEAVSFLKIIKESLEQPQRLFLNI